VKALAPPSVDLVQDAKVGVVLDAARLHVFTSDGGAVLSAGGDPIFSVRATS
jgi:hypothetical protein